MSGETEQGPAIDAYEMELKARRGEEVKLSEINTRMLHDWVKVLESRFWGRASLRIRNEIASFWRKG